MNKKDAKKFEKLLLAERERLNEGVRILEKDTLYNPASEDNSADIAKCAEVGTDNFEREIALNIASGEAELLQAVNDALDRISAGKYGDCEGCDKPIPRKRLEVFPMARFCVECQSKLEKQGYL